MFMYIAARMRETIDSFRDHSMGRSPVVGTVDGTHTNKGTNGGTTGMCVQKKVPCSSVASNLIGVITKHCLPTKLPGPIVQSPIKLILD